VAPSDRAFRLEGGYGGHNKGGEEAEGARRGAEGLRCLVRPPRRGGFDLPSFFPSVEPIEPMSLSRAIHPGTCSN